MSARRPGAKPLLIALAVIVFVVVAALNIEPMPAPGAPAVAPERLEDLSAEEALAAAEAFYKSRPLYERPHPYTPVPEGLPDLRAETCGACHAEIYAEWQLSTHRRAWLDDAQFMEELAKSRGDHAEPGAERHDVSWMCVNCHTPLVNQLEKLVVGLEDGDIAKPIYVDNPVFDAELQLDAITCATCHVQDGVVLGPRGDSEAAPHPVAKGDHLLDEENCVRCHQAEALFPEQNLGCFFTTGAEWSQSEFAEKGQHCQDCHMPRTERPIARGFDVPVRKTRHHWFGGSLIPKKPEYEAEIAPLREIFGSGASISLEGPAEDCAGDGCADARVVVLNDKAGHRFPTGDPERHVDVSARVLTPEGDELTRNAVRIGAIFAWWPEIKLQSDNRLMPGESLELELSWKKEELANTGPVIVEIEAVKQRMHEEAFDFHELEGRYVRGRHFHRSRWEVAEGGEVRLLHIEDDFGARQTLAPREASPSPE